LSLFIAFLTLALSSSRTPAAEQISATGQIFFSITPVSAREVDGRTLATGELDGSFTGTLSGPFHGEFTNIYGGTPAAQTLYGTATCTCSIEGVGTGTLTSAFTGSGLSGSARTAIVGGTGDLASVNGQGTLVVVVPGAVTDYAINLVIT
jgi:hypothetical protein